MHCPFCGQQETRVVDSRLAAEGDQIRRRRECAACEARFTTFERAEVQMPRVRKRDGTPEPFNEAKLRRGIDVALYKRNVSAEMQDRAIGQVIHKIRTQGDRDVDSDALGQWVMEALRELDEVAYIRFASVYLNFSDSAAFRDEVDLLQAMPNAELKRHQIPLLESDDEGN